MLILNGSSYGNSWKPLASLLSLFSLISIISTNSLFYRFIKEKHFTISKKYDNILRKCESWQVCNKVDTYSAPWIERQCRCPNSKPCSTSLNSNDGRTIIDKTKQYKICEPVNKLTTCRHFRDVTWTLTSYPDNRTEQIMSCICPKNSIAYIFKHQSFEVTNKGIANRYLFACSPESKMKCRRKEPCRLFTVMKRNEFEEVNTSTLCNCGPRHYCPAHHKHPNVIPTALIHWIRLKLTVVIVHHCKPMET
ncbi:protein giant-lens-like [Panonychus citri]|uniref:protein giant-lens-like n=1 Tax=Panonychus citri TaxID=50023 RepID=UPI0023078DA2|nr:protein giant-lens-like [Panonychus citri]XP_053210768.1 protein giant-lens-like [Panonychus citri]XP_053210769.1 protein giant-lens-like [Panonychus citri]